MLPGVKRTLSVSFGKILGENNDVSTASSISDVNLYRRGASRLCNCAILNELLVTLITSCVRKVEHFISGASVFGYEHFASGCNLRRRERCSQDDQNWPSFHLSSP